MNKVCQHTLGAVGLIVLYLFAIPIIIVVGGYKVMRWCWRRIWTDMYESLLLLEGRAPRGRVD